MVQFSLTTVAIVLSALSSMTLAVPVSDSCGSNGARVAARDYVDLATRDYYDFEPELSRRDEEPFVHGLMKRDDHPHMAKSMFKAAMGAGMEHVNEHWR